MLAKAVDRDLGDASRRDEIRKFPVADVVDVERHSPCT
jgi:hypothetical protein